MKEFEMIDADGKSKQVLASFANDLLKREF
jgi:hypothetical protein